MTTKFNFRKVTKAEFLGKLKKISLYKWLAIIALVVIIVFAVVAAWYFTSSKTHHSKASAPNSTKHADTPTVAPTAAPTQAPTPAPTPDRLTIQSGRYYIVRYKNKWNMYANPTENGNVEFTGNYTKFQFIKVGDPGLFTIKANGAFLTTGPAETGPAEKSHVTISGGSEDRALVFTVRRVSDNIVTLSLPGRNLEISDGKLVTTRPSSTMSGGLSGIFNSGIGGIVDPEMPAKSLQLYITGTV